MFVSNPWIAFCNPSPAARLRLFCFPYAGGTATVYRSWANRLPSGIEVVPVQLPGRGKRFRERPFTRVAALAEALIEALAPLFDRPFAFFGHSMGALIAYELAHRMSQDSLPVPKHLLASGRRPPAMPDREASARIELFRDLPDPDLAGRLREMNGTPKEVLASPEMMRLMLPLLRADLELNESCDPSGRPALGCSITALGGTEDRDFDRQDLELWRALTTGAFSLSMLPGDHFYLHQPRELLAAIGQALEGEVA